MVKDNLIKEEVDMTMYPVFNEGQTTLLWLFAEEAEELGDEAAEHGTLTVTKAWPVRVENPLTRAGAINAAEMAAYGLKDGMEVASFTAGLARKFRENPEDEEVREHDLFILEVKRALDEIGVR